MVDTVIVGRYLGASALAGVGATGAISFLVVGFATGICTGLSIPVAQAFGAGDYHSMRKNIANSYYLGALIGVLLTILTMIGTGTILHWMKTPDDIYQYSYDYIIVIFGGILTSVLYNSLAAILRAVGDSKSPILFLAISSVLNIILDLVFLVGMQSGVAGAGYATVISQGISGILCLIYLYKKFHIMRFQHGECKPELKRCGRLLSIGLPMALQFSITAIGSIILQTSVNSLGSLAVTSVTAAQKICAIVMGPLESLGITMATFCGQNLGAKKFYRIRDGIRLSMYVSMCYCAFCIAFLWILGKYTAYLFLRQKVNALSFDGILDGGMVEQLLEENVWTPFPQFQHTERPDKAASGLLEGRIVLVVDNSPGVLILPVTYQMFFQAGDDYYTRFEVASFARLLRFAASLFAIGFPGLYVAIAAFHTEMLPTSFLLSIATARTGIVIPVALEVLLMEFQFELLKEAGIHLPGQLGGTIGIVGGLIVGQAAVEAGIVSTIVVIVVSFTAIASFIVPNESFGAVFRLLKFLFIVTAAIWGIYGYLLTFAAFTN